MIGSDEGTAVRTVTIGARVAESAPAAPTSELITILEAEHDAAARELNRLEVSGRSWPRILEARERHKAAEAALSAAIKARG